MLSAAVLTDILRVNKEFFLYDFDGSITRAVTRQRSLPVQTMTFNPCPAEPRYILPLQTV